MKAFMGVALALFGSAQAQTVVYDTFNEAQPEILFDCCNALTITGPHTEAKRNAVAVPFTPEAFSKIREVDIALSTFAPVSKLKISINGSENGLPGREKKAWSRNPSPAGQCCQYVVATVGQAVHAAAGGHYWIIVEGQDDAQGGWNLNSMGTSGPYAVRQKDGAWTMTEGPLPAVRIIAK